MIMVKDLSKFREPSSVLSTPGEEKETYDKVGACKDRKQWGAAELCNCHTNYGKQNTKEKRGLVLNKKGKASRMDIKTTQYAMLLLYKYPLQKSTRTYCLSEMPM